ncbi:outer membrane lipoprotein carrier protein LolA [Hymenobacter sp. BT664]|uniref:Outer membrane lipoprotein carrier protein LolA n=1 Tax=Hymenobacter montanus TaxID=2771359 RepID=A0A927GIW9_9BACT|nr:outer membrane lipoprotein carrier protein LolA [Hymenobacter montanus]MBD2767800.1 outer membrane lipoprotein carrier protein LolA [Hymenobacter montanus]
MKKSFSLLLLTASLALPAAAQQDPKAGKILDQMSAKYQAMNAYQATFTQTLENPSAKVKQNINGDIVVSGQKFRLRISGQEVINDGKTTWTYLKNENEVNVSDSDPDSQEMSPSQIYTMYKKGYKYTYVQQAKEGGEPVDVIELAPENRQNDVFKVRLKVRKDGSVKSWQMFKKNGNQYTFNIKKFQANPPVNAATFAFDKAKYKGVKVVDLR